MNNLKARTEKKHWLNIIKYCFILLDFNLQILSIINTQMNNKKQTNN